MRNVHACLVHEQQSCVVDLVHSLRTLDSSSEILLYDGSESGTLLESFPFGRYGVTIVPNPRPMRWGRLHEFAIESMQFALRHCAFDTFTIVDSDQLLLRSGYTHFLSSVMAGQTRTGMFVTDTNPQSPETGRGPARAVFAELDLWRPLFRSFGRTDTPVYWTFWPGTVFTRAAIADVVRAARAHPVAELLARTSIWATEEIVFPTLVALLGHELAVNPCDAAYVRYAEAYDVSDLAAALATPDAYWIHPVTRSYDHPLRAALRSATHSRDLAYPLPLAPRAEGRGRDAEIEAALSAMAPVPGWLGEREAHVLLHAVADMLCTGGSPPYVVEIGSYHGRSTVALGTLLAGLRRPATLFAIDPHLGELGGSSLAPGEDTWESFSNNVASAGLTDVVVPVRSRAEDVCLDAPVSVLFIDGLHDYPNVARDCLRFEGKVVDGGVVAFHDYSEHFPEVVTFVQELAGTGRFALVAQEGSLVVFRKEPRTDDPLEGDDPRPAGAPAIRRGRPRVSCIMPTCDRPEWIERALDGFARQDLSAKELIVLDSGHVSVEHVCRGRPGVRYHRARPGLSLGGLRNLACELADGQFVAHFDDDDWSARWRLTYQLEELAVAPWANICGLSAVIFSNPDHSAAWQYLYPPGSTWVAGGTLCYRRSFWQAHAFPTITEGEDNQFVWAAAPHEVLTCDVNTFFVGHIHSRNTSAKDTSGPCWSPYPARRVKELMVGDAAAIRSLA